MNEYLNKKRSSGDYGKQETLPPSLQTKMNQSFGMDFSSVKVYRNDEMAGTGMKGLASGNRVILSKEINLNTLDGQAVLGHELSHIHAQSQGIGSGHSGLYDNAALEHQADTEGRMAAMGQSVYGAPGGMPIFAGMQNMGGLQPLSGGLSASAGAPLQAKKDPLKSYTSGWKTKGDTTISNFKFNKDDDNNDAFTRELSDYCNKNKIPSKIAWSDGKSIHGLDPNRMTKSIGNSLRKELPIDQAREMYDKLRSGKDEDVTAGALMYKRAIYEHLKKMRNKYGTLLTEMDPKDIMKRIGMKGGLADFAYSQDGNQLDITYNDIPEEHKASLSLGDKDEAEYNQLQRYYDTVATSLNLMFQSQSMLQSGFGEEDAMRQLTIASGILNSAKNLANGIGGPSMSEKTKKKYQKYLGKKK